MTTEQLEAIRMESMEQYGFGTSSMMKIKVCVNCGATSDISDQFCKECGIRLPSDNLFQIYRKKHKCCPVCETVVCDSARYCPQCGKKIKK